MRLNESTYLSAFAVFTSILTCGTMLAGPAQATPYSSLVISKSPVAYWRLGESTGTTAVDEVGTGGGVNDGTYVSTPSLGQPGLITDDSDTAVGLDGSTQYIDAGSDASLHFGGAMTVTAWIKADTLPSSFGVVASQWENSVSQDRFIFGLLSDGKINASMGNGIGATSAGAASTSTVTLGQRHFVAFSFQDGAPGTYQLYFDGSPDPITSTPTAINSFNTSGSADFHIGAQVTGATRYFDGIIDEVAVFDSILTDSDIQALYELGANGLPPVPEPSSFLLLGLGALGLVRLTRRRRRRA